MRNKNSFQVGLEHILNNPNASFLTNPNVFNEIHKQSGLTLTQMVKHIGKKKKEPSEKEKSEQRLKELESKSTIN